MLVYGRYPDWVRELPNGLFQLYQNYWCAGEEDRPPHRTVSEDVTNYLLWLWEDRDSWNISTEELAYLRGFYVATKDARAEHDDVVHEMMGTEQLALREEGQPDNLQTRMERWERANGRSMRFLSPAEWVRVVHNIGCMTEREAWDLFNHYQHGL